MYFGLSGTSSAWCYQRTCWAGAAFPCWSLPVLGSVFSTEFHISAALAKAAVMTYWGTFSACAALLSAQQLCSKSTWTATSFPSHPPLLWPLLFASSHWLLLFPSSLPPLVFPSAPSYVLDWFIQRLLGPFFFLIKVCILLLSLGALLFLHNLHTSSGLSRKRPGPADILPLRRQLPFTSPLPLFPLPFPCWFKGYQACRLWLANLPLFLLCFCILLFLRIKLHWNHSLWLWLSFILVVWISQSMTSTFVPTPIWTGEQVSTAVLWEQSSGDLWFAAYLHITYLHTVWSMVCSTTR